MLHFSRDLCQRSRVQGEVPFGPEPFLRLDTAFSVLEVDQMVERYEGSAAPIYPLPACGSSCAPGYGGTLGLTGM